MNTFLPSRYLESIHRLAVGIEPIDAVRRTAVAWPIEVAREGRPVTEDDLRRLRERRMSVASVLSRVKPHASRVHVVLWSREERATLTVRLFDADDRFVPRRLEIPVAGLPTSDPARDLDRVSIGQRTRRPALFPGAAYPVSAGFTALRGRVVRPNPADPARPRPIRWARAQARVGDEIVGVAHGDHRGEFLMLISSNAAPHVGLPSTLRVEVQAFAPPAQEPFPAWRPEIDPHWDLPLERLAAPGTTPDPVADGMSLVDYTPSISQLVALPYGRTVSIGNTPFVIP